MIHYIHPVHAVFPFAELTHEAASLHRFFDLLEGIEIDDRYAIVNCVASLVGLKPNKPQHELDQLLKRCRQFREACLRSDFEESHAVRAFVEHIFDNLFRNVCKTSMKELAERNERGISECLSCDTKVFEINRRELRRSNESDSHFRLECLERYMLFGERVAGPLIGYC